MYTVVLSAIYFLIVAVYLSLIVSGRHKYAMMVFMSSLPLKHVYIMLAGHYLELWKLLSILSLPLTFKFLLRKSVGQTQVVRLTAVYFFVVVVSFFLSVLLSNIDPESKALDINLKVIIAQSVQLAAFLNLIFLPAILLHKNGRMVNDAMIPYIFIMVLLSVLGILQYFIYKTSGINIFPIPRVGGEVQDEALINYIGGVRVDPIFRITSLAMEPKNFAFYCAVAIVFFMEIKHNFKRYVCGRLSDVLIIIGFLSCIYLTYSSLGLAVLSLYAAFRIFLVKRSAIGLLGSLALISSLIFLAPSGITEVINDRLFVRIASSGVLEDFDIATLDFFISNPLYIATGVGYGNIHVIADSYLPDFAQWASGQKWHAKMGWLYVLSGAGLIGLFVLSLIFITGYRYVKNHRIHDNESRIIASLLIFFSCIYFLRLTEIVFLVVGFSLLCFLRNRDLLLRRDNP